MILAPTIIPKGFVDARQITEKLINAVNIDEQEYRFGNTKVSFCYQPDHHRRFGMDDDNDVNDLFLPSPSFHPFSQTFPF